MHIAINCRSFLTKNYTGIGRYASQLVRSLASLDHDNHYALYVKKRLFDQKRKAPQITASNFSTVVDYFNQGPQRLLKKIDLYHSPGPDVIRMDHTKVVVTIHDLVYKAYPQGHTQDTLRLTDEQVHSFLPTVSKLICVSQNTKNDVMKFFNVDEHKLTVIHHGVDQGVFYPVAEDDRRKAQAYLQGSGIIQPYILYVGTIEPRKNLKNLFLAFKRLKDKNKWQGKLVVAGMMGWKTGQILDELARFNLRDDVIFLGFVDDEKLRYLYSLARVFVFPSFYEGFGYPLIEAFSCGAAVCCSTTSSCPEIAAEAALFFDPENVEQMAQRIDEAVDDESLNNKLRQKAMMRAQIFTLEKVARETMRVYQEVYKS